MYIRSISVLSLCTHPTNSIKRFKHSNSFKLYNRSANNILTHHNAITERDIRSPRGPQDRSGTLSTTFTDGLRSSESAMSRKHELWRRLVSPTLNLPPEKITNEFTGKVSWAPVTRRPRLRSSTISTSPEAISSTRPIIIRRKSRSSGLVNGCRSGEIETRWSLLRSSLLASGKLFEALDVDNV